MNKSSEKTKPLAADSPKRTKHNDPIDSRSPRPEIVMGILPMRTTIGNIKMPSNFMLPEITMKNAIQYAIK